MPLRPLGPRKAILGLTCASYCLWFEEMVEPVYFGLRWVGVFWGGVRRVGCLHF